MANTSNKIGVVYLMWVPYGITYFKAFVNSYIQHPAGIEHELWILLNGVEGDIPTGYSEILQQHNITHKIIAMQNGQDINAYRYAAAQMEVELVLFLNTYSLFLADNWLKKYSDAFNLPATGVVSATATNQSHYSSVYATHAWKWENEKGFVYNFRKYKLFIKAFFYWRWLFKPFPSPHVRSNAFMIRRDLFLELKPAYFKDKFAAYQFENGRNSMTVQCWNKGLSVLLIDKNGKTYTPEKWKESAVYRINNQENLLISDNQTLVYDKATAAEKKFMEKMAWG